MPTPSIARDALPQSRCSGHPTPPPTNRSEWRCTSCAKLLGMYRDGRMHLRFARGHEYFAGFPVVATCRGCGTLNHASSPAR